jgi:hypothetical protein
MEQFILRIELYDRHINIPPRVQTNIENVNGHLKNIMNEVASKMPGWKFLDRCEASISTDNEEKQIRESLSNCMYPNQIYIDFKDDNSLQRVSIDEWKQFGKLIEYEINEIIHARCGVTLLCDISTSDDEE